MTKPEQNTRAAVPAPKRKSGTLPPPPPVAKPADNMKGERLAPMTFNMPRDWHTRFKVTATTEGLNMKELLIACFEAWERERARDSQK